MVECQAGDASRRDWSTQRLASLGTGCVPDFDHAVVSDGGQFVPIGFECHAKDSTPMAGECKQGLTRGSIPEPDGVIDRVHGAGKRLLHATEADHGGAAARDCRASPRRGTTGVPVPSDSVGWHEGRFARKEAPLQGSAGFSDRRHVSHRCAGRDRRRADCQDGQGPAAAGRRAAPAAARRARRSKHRWRSSIRAASAAASTTSPLPSISCFDSPTPTASSGNGISSSGRSRTWHPRSMSRSR